MSLPRRSGKRRRSASGSDSFSGDGDSYVSPQLPSRPVLSPPPALGRRLRASGAGSRTAGPPRPEGSRGKYSIAGAEMGPEDRRANKILQHQGRDGARGPQGHAFQHRDRDGPRAAGTNAPNSPRCPHPQGVQGQILQHQGRDGPRGPQGHALQQRGCDSQHKEAASLLAASMPK